MAAGGAEGVAAAAAAPLPRRFGAGHRLFQAQQTWRKKKEAARAEEEAEEEVLAAASFARGVEHMGAEGDASPRWSEASIGSAASAGVVLTARGAKKMMEDFQKQQLEKIEEQMRLFQQQRDADAETHRQQIRQLEELQAAKLEAVTKELHAEGVRRASAKTREGAGGETESGIRGA